MNDLDHENYNCRVIYEDGQQQLIYANWLHNQGLDHWTGWQCQAGSRRLHIDKDFQVYSGECRNDYLGSALTGIVLLEKTVCKQTTCTGCTDDLLVTKHE